MGRYEHFTVQGMDWESSLSLLIDITPGFALEQEVFNWMVVREGWGIDRMPVYPPI